LLLSVSSTPNEYQVVTQMHLQKQPQIVSARMVSLSQVLPARPKVVDHILVKKVVKPKPKHKVTRKVTVKKALTKSKPKRKKVVKLVVHHKASSKQTLNKKTLGSMRNMALSGINSAVQQHWQTEKEKYFGLIQQLVRSNWNNPDQGDDLQVVLLIRLNMNGKVDSVIVSQSSGNAAFDRQAVLAVQKSSPLPLPKNQQLAQQFATLKLPFSH